MTGPTPAARPTGRPTLADVAELAGVSLKTASRAVNAEYGVAAATAQRVLEAARTLGFRPNRMARSLAAGGTSAAVGMVLPSVADPFMAALVGAVEDVLSERDLHLVTISHGDDPERQRSIVRALVERRVDALVMVPAPGPCDELRVEIGHGLAVVALDRPLPGMEPGSAFAVDTLVTDNEAGAARAVEALASRGNRRIAVLGNHGVLWTLQRRHDGYRQGLANAGIEYDPALVDLDCVDSAGAESSLTRMLSLDRPPTAVLAVSNLTSTAAMRAARRIGVTIDVAVFDAMTDLDLYATPPVLEVTCGPSRIGHLGGRMLIERLDGSRASARSVVLEPLFDQPQVAP